jgi:hypothetical protein
MGRFQGAIALVAVAALMLAVVAPAAARSSVGVAWGSVTWAARDGEAPGLVSRFVVRDGTPGQASSNGDRGWYRLTRPEPTPGTLTLDVKCVRVSPDWTEFAGVVTHASGVYVVGEVFRVSVVDGGKRGAGDEIGMKSSGFDLERGCALALDDKELGRQGVISKGDIAVRTR